MKIRQTGTHRKGQNAVHNEAMLRIASSHVSVFLRANYRVVPMPKRPFPKCPICKGGDTAR